MEINVQMEINIAVTMFPVASEHDSHEYKEDTENYPFPLIL